jgi:tRNA threonylcarbamoyladenosine biosynthesis protein TsaE
MAAALGDILRPGDVVSLTGELGAGKTCFVQGAARALGVEQRVTSPSFLLRRDYDGDVGVMHIDVYRLERLQEVLDIGFEEAGDGQRVTFIEWGDAMSPLLPANHLEVEFLLGPIGAVQEDGDEVRLVKLRAKGDDWKRRLVGAAARLGPWIDRDGGG